MQGGGERLQTERPRAHAIPQTGTNNPLTAAFIPCVGEFVNL